MQAAVEDVDAHGSACLVVDANVTLPHCLRVSGDVTIHGAEGTAWGVPGVEGKFAGPPASIPFW